MSNAIAINVSTEIQFRRESKSGKVTTRGALGALMSGNKSELSTLSRVACKALIANNTFAPVMDEISRVFPASCLLKFGAFKIAETFAFIDGKTIMAIDGNWDAMTSGAYCRAVVARCSALEAQDKTVKGEKSLAWEFAEEVVRHLDEKALAKLAAMTAATA